MTASWLVDLWVFRCCMLLEMDSIVSEYGFVAMRGGCEHAYFMGVWLAKSVKIDIGRHIMFLSMQYSLCSYTVVRSELQSMNLLLMKCLLTLQSPDKK